MMKISVIMLTYNREDYIDRAINSVLNQEFQDFEFIIVDNGSTDNSGKIADSYADKFDNIKVIHLTKKSIGAGRNAGLDAAKGDFITFIDDDDITKPDMLKFLYELVIQNNADISICGSNKIVNEEEFPNCVYDEKLIMTPSQAVVELLKRKKYNAAMPTKLLKRELFDKIKFKEDGKYDDITVTYKYLANSKKVVYYGLPKYCFYRHENNNSSFTTNDLLLTPFQLDEYFEAFRERTKYLSSILPDIADYAQYSEWSYMISMCNKIEKNNLSECSEQLKLVKEELSSNYDEFYTCPYIENFEKEFMLKYIKRG